MISSSRLLISVGGAAGIAYKGSIFGPSELKATLDTNFRGTMAISERLKGLLTRPGGRVVNVGSRWCSPMTARTVSRTQLTFPIVPGVGS